MSADTPWTNPIDGATGMVEERVDAQHTADRYGNTGLEVLATPALVGLCERAAMAALAEHLPEGARTVGTLVELQHLAPTPVGATVTVNARVERTDGRLVWFALQAHDGDEEIGVGRHCRAVVDGARFEARVDRKRKALLGDRAPR